MFSHLSSTKYPPKEKPLMVFDGTCGFCKYWVIKWKMMTGDKMDYKPFQEAASDFPDIKKSHFAEAVRCILPDGTIYSGPEAAYYTAYFLNRNAFLFKWYRKNNLFKKANDWVYQWIADNRDFTFRLCLKVLGKNPRTSATKRILFFLILLIVLTVAIYSLANI